MISSVGSQIQAYSASKIYTDQAFGKSDNTLSKASDNQGTDNSTRQARKDTMRTQMDKVAGDDTTAEEMLRNYSRPDSGGVLFAVGANDLNTIDTTALRRLDRINELFNQEFKQVQNQTADIISEGRASEKKPQEILEDIYNLYDSQSELFKTGRGWDGQLFAMSVDNPSGYEMTMQYASDVVDIRA